MEKAINAKDLLDEKFGKKGSGSRTKFNEDAYAFYFGELLKKRRKELHISQEELAQKVGKKRPYISRVENGEDIRLSTFALIAKALGLNIQVQPD